MENSALTRQATRARIGPWYVMQSKNPSAPGMKCNTLLALIRKGQITPRSVIRGPTTFQLWRFAARVKGISREFGLCYSCGAELQRTSTFCPRCSRSQELPPNPDVLLENEPQQPASKTPVYREVNQRPSTPETPAAEPTRSAEPEPLRASRPASQIPSAAETMAELAEIPSPHNAPQELQSRPRQRPQEGVLTPRELAAAFSLQYDPTMDTSATSSRSRRKGKGGLIAAAVFILAVGGGAAAFWYNPSLRERLVAWVQDSTPSAPAPVQSAPPKPVPDHTPDWMMTVPNDAPPITTPSKPTPSNTVADATPVQTNSSSNSSGGNSSGGNSGNSTGSSAAVPSNVAPPNPTPTPAPAPAPTAVPVVQQQAPPVVQTQTPPPPAHDTPITTSLPPDSRISTAQDAVTKLRQEDGTDLDQFAMDLRSDGLDAEHRQDYFSAQYFYQQVETLSRDHWPQDIEQRLKDVQHRLGAPEGAQ
jgi:hypothetical protein